MNARFIAQEFHGLVKSQRAGLGPVQLRVFEFGGLTNSPTITQHDHFLLLYFFRDRVSDCIDILRWTHVVL
jgi:hypothetical protein